jgi:hypothetical protein
LVLSLSAFVMLAAAAAGGAAVEPRDVSRLSATLDSLKWARVSASGGIFELERPHLADDGLHFRRAKGFPTPRPALITDSRWRPTPPPREPIPFAEITRIERPVRRMSVVGLPIGAALGLASGLVVGVPAAYILGYESNNPGAAYGALLGCMFLGAYLGGRFMGESREWQPIYPSP